MSPKDLVERWVELFNAAGGHGLTRRGTRHAATPDAARSRFALDE
jgi:hypothetical protein